MTQPKIAKIGYISISIIFYITGVYCLFAPGRISENEEIIAGVILIAYGIIKIIGYFSKDLYCLAFQYDFACGILLVVLGIVMFLLRNRIDTIYFLILLGVLILLDSLLGIQTAMDAKKFGMTEWRNILIFSIISGIFSVLLVIGETVLAAGFALLAEGIMRHYIVYCTVYLPDTESI